MLGVARTLAGVLLVSALLCAGNLCISASKEGGRVPYLSVTATFLIEVLKLALMLAAIAASRTPPPPRMPLRESALYAVPSLLYAVDNNLNYVILRFLDPATLAVLWNLKILTTAVLFRLVLKRELSELRKIAIALLLLGVVTSQSDHLEKQARAAAGEATGSSSADGTGTSPRDFSVGILLVLIGVTISSCASVFTEWTFKRKSDCPFMWQNVMLYVYGILFNGFALLAEHDEITERGFFDGYNGWTAAVIAVNCVGGISMGLILKFLDNIACVYSHAVAMMLTMLFSMLFFHFSPSLEFACGLAVVVISMYLYHHKVDAGSDSASPTCSSSSSSSCSSSNPSLALNERQRETLDVAVPIVELPTGLHLKKKRYEKLPTDATINGANSPDHF